MSSSSCKVTRRASSTRLLEEAELAASKEQKFIKAENAALCEALHELELIHQAVSIEQNKKLASKKEDLLKLGTSSTHQLEEAKSSVIEKQNSIEAENEALRVILHELEEDRLKIGASSTRQLEEAKLAATKEQKSIGEDNVALRVKLHELELNNQAARIDQGRKLVSKEEDL